MAIHSRRKVEENEEESVFISMTDLMISILFIIMILMAYFSTRIDPNIQVVEKSKYEKVLLELEAAEELIGTLNNEIDQQKVEILDLKVKISDLEIIILKLKKELENIKIELDREIGKNAAYRERIIILEKELENIEKKIDVINDLKRKIVLLNLEIVNLNKINKELRDKLSDTVPKELLANQETLIKKLRMTITTLKKQVEDLEGFIRQLQKQIEDLEDYIRKLQKQLEEYQKRSMETVLDAISRDRKNLLISIKEQLAKLQIKVEVHYDSGIVRFGEKALKFGSGKYEPDEAGINVISTLAKILSEELPCFTLGPHTKIDIECNPNSSIVETIQIEGHTDNDPVSQRTIALRNIKDNLQLSTMRAAETWRVVTNKNPEILEFFNAEYYEDEDFDIRYKPGQAVLSVSGYGAARPINKGTTKTAKAENRRIDLRFIMMTPRNLDEADILGQKIKQGVGGN